jgi:rhodanese-related sulfurtransferase
MMATEQIKFISLQHLKRMVEGSEPYKLVDVRGKDEFAAGHIKGAMNIPLDELDRVKGLLKPADLVIVYCDSFVCSASSSAAKMLLKMGFVNVRDYKGGMREWKLSGLPVE